MCKTDRALQATCCAITSDDIMSTTLGLVKEQLSSRWWCGRGHCEPLWPLTQPTRHHLYAGQHIPYAPVGGGLGIPSTQPKLSLVVALASLGVQTSEGVYLLYSRYVLIVEYNRMLLLCIVEVSLELKLN